MAASALLVALPAVAQVQIGGENAAIVPGRAELLSLLQQSRSKLSGIKIHARTEEFVAGTVGVYRAFDEQIWVHDAGSRLSQTYEMSSDARSGNGEKKFTVVIGQDGEDSMMFTESAKAAVLAQNLEFLKGKLTSEFSFFSRWFPVATDPGGWIPYDLANLLASGVIEVAPFSQDVDGAPCWVLFVKPEGSLPILRIWVDPERGYFPRLQRTYDEAGISAEWHTTEFLEVAEDCWVPAEGVYWNRGLAGRADVLQHPFDRQMRLIAGGDFEEGAAFFTGAFDPLAVPSGTLVEDLESGSTWYAGTTNYRDSASMAIAGVRLESESPGLSLFQRCVVVILALCSALVSFSAVSRRSGRLYSR